jgi:hypothetical protein
VNQEVVPDDYSFSRMMMGAIDRHGGALSRLGGKIAHGSSPMSSIWSIHQLRFKDNWGIVVQNGSSRDWYDHNAYKGPEDGFIDPNPDPDPTVEITIGEEDPSDIILPGDDSPHEPNPAYCHSDIIVHYGIYEYPVDDLLICERTRGTPGWLGIPGWRTSLQAAYDESWQYVLNYTWFPAMNPLKWGDWTRRAPDNLLSIANPPHFRVWVTFLNYATPLYHVFFSFRQYQHRACSDTLANPPVSPCGGAYEHAKFYSGGLGLLDLADYIGNPLAACSATDCSTLITPELTIGEDPEMMHDAGNALISTFNPLAGVFTPAYSYDQTDALASSNPGYNKNLTGLVLSTNICGRFEHVNSHLAE